MPDVTLVSDGLVITFFIRKLADSGLPYIAGGQFENKVFHGYDELALFIESYPDIRLRKIWKFLTDMFYNDDPRLYKNKDVRLKI